MNLTVIIPVKNEKDNIRKLLNNIVDFKNHMIFLFVDAYSTDGSYEILKSSNYNVIRQPPKGIYSAFNFGIQNTTTQFCMFLGADDSLLPDLINLSIELTSYEFCMLICQSLILPANKITNHHENDFNLINKNFCHQSIIYNIDYIKKNYFDTRHNIMADWLLNLKLYSKYHNYIYFKDEIISTYKQGGFSGNNFDLLWEKKHLYYKIQYLKLFNLFKFVLNRWVSAI